MTRLRRMVEQHAYNIPGYDLPVLPVESAVNLLEREHRAMVRLVKRLRVDYLATKPNFKKAAHIRRLAYVKAIDDVLAAMEKRNKSNQGQVGF